MNLLIDKTERVQLFSSEGERSGAECVLPLLNTGVESLLLSFEVETPVLLEVAVCDHCSKGEDRLGAVQAPSRASYVEAVGDEVAACSLDDAGRDRPAGREGLVVAQEVVLVSQIADACVGPGQQPPAGGVPRSASPSRSPSPEYDGRRPTH
jgi:hypothetical protein